MRERFSAVVHLAVHLKKGQRVYFTNENVQERVARPPATILTTFFSIVRK